MNTSSGRGGSFPLGHNNPSRKSTGHGIEAVLSFEVGAGVVDLLSALWEALPVILGPSVPGGAGGARKGADDVLDLEVDVDLDAEREDGLLDVLDFEELVVADFDVELEDLDWLEALGNGIGTNKPDFEVVVDVLDFEELVVAGFDDEREDGLVDVLDFKELVVAGFDDEREDDLVDVLDFELEEDLAWLDALGCGTGRGKMDFEVVVDELDFETVVDARFDFELDEDLDLFVALGNGTGSDTPGFAVDWGAPFELDLESPVGFGSCPS